MFEITREQWQKVAKTPAGKWYLRSCSVEDRLDRISVEDKLTGLSVEEQLTGHSKKEWLDIITADLTKEELQAFLSRFSVGEDGRA